MTYEEKAEKYLEPIHRMYSCNNEHYTDEVIIQAYLDGLAEGKPKWHDLRKDPNDLPKENGCYWGYANYFGFQYRKIYWLGNKFDVTRVIAWCELPKFEE